MFKNYLKVAWRALFKHKTYTLINISSFGVGIAACLIILLYVRYELSYDRYHTNADRIYRVASDTLDEDGPTSKRARVGSPWGPGLQEAFPEVEDFVRFRFVGTRLFQHGDKRFFETEGLFTDPQIFEVFNYEFVSGDPANALSERNSIVITEALAEKYFGSSDAIGKEIKVDRENIFVVSAVLKDLRSNSHFKFDFLLSFEVHASSRPDWMGGWQVGNYHVYLLLTETADHANLEAKIAKFSKTKLPPENAATVHYFLQPMTSIHLHSDLFREFEPNGNILYVYVFSVIAVLILLVACINFMNLTTARSTTRAREVGMRKVIGAVKSNLIIQFLGEAIALAILGGLLALVLAELFLPTFNDISGKNLALNLSSNMGLAATLAGICLLVGILAGSYPAIYISRFHPASVLKGQESLGLLSGGRLRKVLVVAQFVTSIVLLLGTTVIYKQVNFLRSKDPGFNRDQIVVIPLRDDSLTERYETFRSLLVSNPGVLDVTFTSGNFGGGDWGIPIDATLGEQQVKFGTRMMNVDHNYVDVMQMQIVEGRDFDKAFQTDFEAAFVINESAAKLITQESALGASLNAANGWRTGTVIGVAKDFNYRALHETIEPMVFFIVPGNFQLAYVKITPENIPATLAFLKKTYTEMVPDQPYQYSFLDETFEQFYEGDAKFGKTIAYSTGLAVFVACVGLLGLASFAAEMRTREVGIRKVLGASVTEIVRLLSLDFVKLVALANLIAWPVAYYLMNNWLAEFPYRTDLSWWLFLVSGTAALFIALATVSVQAIKAGMSNPAVTLHHE